MDDLKDRVSTDTGARRSIGRGIAGLFGKMVETVVLAARSKYLLQEIAQQIKDYCSAAEIFRCNWRVKIR